MHWNLIICRYWDIFAESEKYKKFLGISWDSNPSLTFNLNISQVLLPLDHLDTCQLEDKLHKQHCLESTGPQLHEFQLILTFSELEHWLNFAGCLVVTHCVLLAWCPVYEASVLLAAVLVAIVKAGWWWKVRGLMLFTFDNTRFSQGPCGVVIIWLDYSHYVA